VNNGNTVTVRQTSSSSYSSSRNTTLTIGGVTDTFTVTTESESDTIPDQFTFTDQTNVPRSSVRTSNSITVSGINAPSAISISGNSGQYRINSGSWRTTLSTVNNGNTVTVRQTSSSSYSTSRGTTLNIGGVSDTFTVTTESEVGDSYEVDDTAQQATVIATNGTPQTHSIHVASDVDWVRFTLSETANVTIETDGSSGDTRMWLYGPNSTTAQVEFDDDGGTGTFSKIVREGANAIGPGTYYVKIDEFGNNNTIGSYTITVTEECVGGSPVIIDDGDVIFGRYSDIGFRDANGGGYQNDYDYGGRGIGSSATWRFTGLTAGVTYDVSATWVPHPNRATDAPYRINGSAPVRVDQEREPQADFTAGGRPFQSLGSFIATSDGVFARGVIEVELGVDANEYVIADAVRVQQLCDDDPALDTTRPTATGSAPNIMGGGSGQTVTVQYSDNVAVDASDIGTGDIRVTGSGFDQTATFVSVSSSSDGTPRTGTYRITAPGGT
jgi:hypothetical protein